MEMVVKICEGNKAAICHCGRILKRGIRRWNLGKGGVQAKVDPMIGCNHKIL